MDLSEAEKNELYDQLKALRIKYNALKRESLQQENLLINLNSLHTRQFGAGGDDMLNFVPDLGMHPQYKDLMQVASIGW
jgi:hypothetical protein